MSGKLGAFSASDYAGIEAGGIWLYYGYEVTDEEGNWCFEAKLGGGKRIVIPASKLPKTRGDNSPVDKLLAGIAALLESEWLVAGGGP